MMGGSIAWASRCVCATLAPPYFTVAPAGVQAARQRARPYTAPATAVHGLRLAHGDREASNLADPH